MPAGSLLRWIAAAAFLPASAFASIEAPEGHKPPPPLEGHAFIETYLVENGWTPAEGWPPAEYPSPDTLSAIHWVQVEEKGEVPLEGGPGGPELRASNGSRHSRAYRLNS